MSGVISDGVPMKELTPLPTRGGGSGHYRISTQGTAPTFIDRRDPLARFDANLFFLNTRAAWRVVRAGEHALIPMIAIPPPISPARFDRNEFRVILDGATDVSVQ